MEGILQKLAVILLLASITVAQEPTLELQPTLLSKAVGENVYVSCVANVPNKELIEEMKWFTPDGQEIPRQDEAMRVSTTSFSGKGTLDLMIGVVEQDDGGIYKCTAIYAGNNKIEKEIDIKVYKDIDFGDTQTFQTPKINTDAKIKCLVTAFPAPQVDWLKDREQLVSDNRHIIQQDGILIKDIDTSAEGIYKCRARVPKFGLIKSIDIKVEVHEPPKITQKPEDVRGVEKEAVNFQCIATGKPSPTFTWVDKDAQPLQDKEGYHVNDETGELTIMNLNPQQAGEYTCTATNPAGFDVATANLQILTKPKIENYENITVDVTKEAQLKCYASGDPLPNIVFKKETNPDPFTDGMNEDSRIYVTQSEVDGKVEAVLEISELERRDDGLYTCSADSDGGKTVAWGHITAQFGPTFEKQANTEFWSWEQEKVNLTCVVSSIPNATVEWYWMNKEIPKDDPNLVVLSHSWTSVLEVNPADPSYFASYSCQATNVIGTATLDLTLKQAHKPGILTNSQVKKKTATTIEWELTEPINNGGRPVTSFQVEYRLSDESWDDSETKFWSKGAEYIIDGLSPLSTYVFRFAARNEVGLGEWGGEKSEEMPKISAPEVPVFFRLKEGIKNPSPYSDHYELMWQVPLDNGSPISNFELTYYMVKEQEDGSFDTKGDKKTILIDYPGETKYELTGLKSDSIYRIEFRARNQMGNSRPAEVLIQTASGGSTDDDETSSVDVDDVESTNDETPGPDATMKTEGLGIGIIIAIVVISILVIALLIDATCFFAKNLGLIAIIAGKVGDSKLAKDKEAMLEDGMHASEKPEGNGNTKTDEEKVPLTQEEEKPKETEPTETTPMIEEGKTTDKDAIINEEKETLEGKDNEGEKTNETKDSPV